MYIYICIYYIYIYICRTTRQITIVPEPEGFGHFGDTSLEKNHGVTNRRLKVAIQNVAPFLHLMNKNIYPLLHGLGKPPIYI